MVLRQGCRLPFHFQPRLSSRPISLPSYSPSSIGSRDGEGVVISPQKGVVELAPSTPGFYSRLFITQQPSGKWHPIIDLSALNRSVVLTDFHIETPQSVLRSVRQGDWLVSIDLKDAYLQVSVHVDSRRFLRFLSNSRVYQFRVLPFGLLSAPEHDLLPGFPMWERLLKHGFLLTEFWSSRLQPVASWRSPLGVMSPLFLLVLGSRLRMRALQLRLNAE